MEKENSCSFPSNDNDMISSSIMDLSKSDKKEEGNEENNKKNNKKNKTKQIRRNKNLLISIVIKKVTIWKMLRERGITSENAAKYLKIPRKTIERYYDNICKGRKKGFPFNANLQKGIHVLYEYNKSKKTSQTKKE